MAKVNLFVGYASNDSDHKDRLVPFIDDYKNKGLVGNVKYQDLIHSNMDDIESELRLSDVVILIIGEYFTKTNICENIRKKAFEIKRAKKENIAHIMVTARVYDEENVTIIPDETHPISNTEYWRSDTKAWEVTGEKLEKILKSKLDYDVPTIKDLKNEIDQLKKEISTLREENLQNGLVLHYSRPEDKEKGSDKNQVISYLGELKPNGKGNNTGRSFDGKSYLRTDKKQLSLSLFSVCIWFKTNEKNGLLFGCSSKDVEASEDGKYDRFLYIENGKLWFGCFWHECAVINSEMELCDGKWHYVVAKLTPNGMFLYIDGKFIGSEAKSPDTNRRIFVSSHNTDEYEGNWFIGGCYISTHWIRNNPIKKYFTGEIASVRLYDRDLSEREIDILYKKGENY